MATLLVEALKGAQAEVAQQAGLLEQLKRAGRLTGILAQELRAAAALSPFGVRAVRVRSALPTAADPTAAAAAAAAASPYGVVLHPAVPYGSKPRHKVDIYVPAAVYQQPHHQAQQQLEGRGQAACGPSMLAQQGGQDSNSCQRQQQQGEQQQQEGQPPGEGVPVVFFVHGGIWVTGERWHFCPMATRLAQAGLVVVVPSYTLYPDALAGQMPAEVLAAYKWTVQRVGSYGGSPARITVMGHSAGGHLGSLALLMLAQQKHLAVQLQQLQHPQHPQRQELGAPLVNPAAAASRASSSSVGSADSQQQQVHHSLPEQQLQQRADLAAAEAAHHHHTHLGQQPLVVQLLQQTPPPPQQQEQEEGQHWVGSGQWLLAVPTPMAFIGMSSIYDVARHFEFESLRGVAGISAMARACGGAVNFDAVSPAVVLRRAAAADRAAAGSNGASSSRQQYSGGGAAVRPAGQQLPALQAGHDPQDSGAGPVLLGEVIPFRSGLDGSRHHATAASMGSGAQPASSSSRGSSIECPVSGLLAGFSAAAAKWMPPCILMSSLGDHMVPWHEAAEMFLALRACSVPAKHLIYDTAQHNDFVLDWVPLRGAAATAAAAAARQTAAPGSGPPAHSSSGALPAFARDLLAILTGQQQVRLDTGSSAQTAAAVEALERAAGLPQLHEHAHSSIPGLSMRGLQPSMPQPLSRL